MTQVEVRNGVKRNDTTQRLIGNRLTRKAQKEKEEKEKAEKEKELEEELRRKGTPIYPDEYVDDSLHDED